MLPPTSAPVAVNSSRDMPRRRLATCRSRYTPGGRAAGHDHRDERDPHRFAQGQPEAEREQRDDEDPATESEEGSEQAGDRAAGDHQQADDHLSRGRDGADLRARSAVGRRI